MATEVTNSVLKPEEVLEDVPTAKTDDDEVGINFCVMLEDMKTEVIAIVQEASRVFAGNTDCSRAVKAQLEKKFGGIWVAFVGEDFGAIFNGKEFKENTLAHFTIKNKGIMLYQCKFARG